MCVNIKDMDLNVGYEVAIQRMINILAEFTKKANALACFPPKKLIEDLNIFQVLIEKEMRTTPMLQHVYEIKICSSRDELKRAVKDVQCKNTLNFINIYNYRSCKDRFLLIALRLNELDNCCLNVLLEEERSKFEAFKKEIIIDIAKEESIYKSIKEMARNNMTEQIKRSEEEILVARKEHQSKIELLQKEINSFLARIKLITVEIVTREKDLKKIHLQTQDRCIELLAKYDRDIGAKYRLFEKLTLENNVFEEEQKKLRVRIRTYLKNQSELYIQLKEEREQAMMRAFLKALENFKRNRAARIIQRTWRWYRERLLLKKKKKTKKK